MSSETGDIRRINDILKARYGVNLQGKSIFRVVFSTHQTEKRFGVFAEFFGKIFLREIRGLREVPKYVAIKDRWVLERWMPPTLAYTPEIPATAEGSYEPVFVFEAEDGSPLPVAEEVIHKIIYHLFHPQLPGDRASDLKAEEAKEFDREVSQIQEELTEQGRTWIGHRLHSGEAIIKP